SQGIDLGDYTTRQSAADLDFVRQALGAKRVDLLGTSYGTWLALEMMRDYGSKVRSAVLNSPVPPQTDLLGGQIVAFQDSLNEVYKGCAADAQCNAAYPHLETTLTALVKKLNAKPLSVTYKDPTTGKDATGDVDGTTIMSLIYQLVFIGPFVPYVAPLIGTVASGDDSFLSQLVPLLVSSNEGISNGLYYAVMCQDEVPFTSVTAIKAQAKKAKVSQDVIDEGLSSSEGTIDVCKDWDLKASPDVENTAVTSSIPTLIVTGKFDPITPTSYGKLLETTLSNATLITSPVAGHDPASTTGTCGVGIIHRFLNEPADKLDTSCLKDLSLDFSPQ
ncbi:MAG TPA: alpha/beta fold hydrolase, partial [Thermomicrobiales bacterium]|nr:alpha/beta fold hydrolase [Thermomicrobiales bacterium]